MAVVVVPVRNDILEYRQQVTFDGESFTMLIKHNLRENAWYFDLLTSDGTVVRHGIKMVTGFPLMARVRSLLRPGGDFVVVDTTGAGIEPDLDTLGVGATLLYVEEADIDAALQ